MAQELKDHKNLVPVVQSNLKRALIRCRYFHALIVLKTNTHTTHTSDIAALVHFLSTKSLLSIPGPTMIFVWGRRQYVTAADQSPLTDIATIDRPAPCMNPSCLEPYTHGVRKVRTVQQYCTIYFCIPLCPVGSSQKVVKCESCGQMWKLDSYLKAVTNQQRNLQLLQLVETTTAHSGGGGQSVVSALMKRDEPVPFAYSCVPVGEPDDALAKQENVVPVAAPVGTLT